MLVSMQKARVDLIFRTLHGSLLLAKKKRLKYLSSVHDVSMSKVLSSSRLGRRGELQLPAPMSFTPMEVSMLLNCNNSVEKKKASFFMFTCPLYKGKVMI